MRIGLASFLTDDGRFFVVGHSSTDEDLPLRIEESQPDVLIVEVERPSASALTIFRELSGEVETRETARSPAVILLFDEPETAYLLEALRAGALAVLPRMSSSAEIAAAVEAAASGLVTLRPQTFEALLSPYPQFVREEFNDGRQVEALTAREVEILGMLAEGLGNKMIAFRLGISDHTVKFHVSSIFAKLGVSSRTEAVTLGIRRGLIML